MVQNDIKLNLLTQVDIVQILSDLSHCVLPENTVSVLCRLYVGHRSIHL